MPVCIKCKLKKSEIKFRLYKRDIYDPPVLSSTCIDCEMKPGIFCFRCSRSLQWYEIYKSSKRLVLCKTCHEKEEAMWFEIHKLKIEKQLLKLIRILELMPSKSIEDLRDHLFATIQDLRSGALTPDVAAQIVDVAKTIIDSARAENEYIALTGSAGSDFIPLRANSLKRIEDK